MKYLIFFLSLASFGCATNPYRQFYNSNMAPVDVENLRATASTKDPELVKGRDLNLDYTEMTERGYFPVGFSSFNAGDVSPQDAISQGKVIKAEIVVLYQTYRNTESGTTPLILPSTQTTQTNFNGNINGSSGGFLGSFNGTSHSTTQGTQTTYIPYSVDRYDYLAGYWVKAKKPKLGAVYIDLSQNTRESIASNKGVEVTAIIRGSPAFNADLMKGDVIRKISTVEVIDSEQFRSLLNEYAGRLVNLEIIRKGKILKKSITLNDPNAEERNPASK